MKKILSCFLVLIVILSLAACGSEEKRANKKEEGAATQSNVDVFEVMENFDASKINAAEGNLKMTANAEAEGEKVDVDVSMDFQGSNFGKDDMALKVPVKVKAQGETIEATLYYADGVLYADTEALLGENLKLEYDLTELLSKMDELTAEEADEPITDEHKEKILEALNPRIKEKGNKYVISVDVDWDKWVAMLEDEGALEDMEGLQQMAFKSFKMTYTCAKDGVIEKITFDADVSMEIESVAIDMLMEGNITFKTGSIDISFPDFDGYIDASAMMNQMF